MKKEVKNCKTCKFFDSVTHYCKSSLSPMYGEYMYDGNETCEVHYMKYKKKKKVIQIENVDFSKLENENKPLR